MDHHPQLDLNTFFLSVSSAALMSMGISAPGISETMPINMDVARQNIDLLELLRVKTQGNRTPDEEVLLQQLLLELRMRFVESNQKNKTGHKML